LRAAIQTAFQQGERRIRPAHARRGDVERLASLTLPEREVMERAAKGLHAKEIAAAFGISPRTVEVHKTYSMARLGVRNVAEMRSA
jgi:two-component system response regulator FixJ